MKTFTAGDINRAEQEMIYPGGKGINVSLVLGNLHIPSKMLGFIAGFTGREIERLAKANGGDTDSSSSMKAARASTSKSAPMTKRLSTAWDRIFRKKNCRPC